MDADTATKILTLLRGLQNGRNSTTILM